MKKSINLNSNEETIALYGSLDERLRFAEREFRVRTSARNHRLIIEGKKTDVARAFQFFNETLRKIRSEVSESSDAGIPKAGNRSMLSFNGQFFHKGKMIRAKSKEQENYLKAIQQYDIVIAIGPAGTGKTYLAMARAVDALKRREVQRIVLTRPAVEAGENLGFLPGDLSAKINPYLRPLYDALYDMMDFDEVQRLSQRGVIEVAPLAYMRGRTLNDSFVILDEAQNCTYEQLKMFLTRLGFSSKMIVTGDITQMDLHLPNGKHSGLSGSQTVLKSVRGIKFICLSEKDVVRHKLVRDIVKAYEKHERKA